MLPLCPAKGGALCTAGQRQTHSRQFAYLGVMAGIVYAEGLGQKYIFSGANLSSTRKWKTYSSGKGSGVLILQIQIHLHDKHIPISLLLSATKMLLPGTMIAN